MEDTDAIREQMTQTRTALAEKLEALESKVMGNVAETTQAVTETVESVQEAVSSTVDTVSETVSTATETVKQAFDFPGYVREYPWAVLGGACLLGYLGGRALGAASGPSWHDDDRHHRHEPSNVDFSHLGAASPGPATSQSSSASASSMTGMMSQAPAGPQEPGWLDTVTEAIGPVTSTLRELSIGVTTGLIGQMAMSLVPQEARQQVGGMIDRMTESLGGKPMHFDQPAATKTSAG